MAKRKRGAALFDVIHHDTRFASRQSPIPSGDGPRSWFRRRPRNPVDIPSIVPEAPAAAPAGPGMIERLAGCIPPLPRFALALDEERGMVRFQLSYTGAVVALAGVFLLVAMGYVLGRHGARQALPALAEQTTEELRAGPADPQVLDVGTDSPLAMAAPAPDPATVTTPLALPAAARQTGSASASAGNNANALRNAAAEPRQTPPQVRITGKRTVGMHYVIVQCYPPEEKQLAEDAVKLLSGNGVPCTIETHVPYAPNWLAVVGCTEFDRVKSSPDYDAYVSRIEQIGAKFGGTSRFKKFEPRPYKWRDSKGQ